MFPNSEKLSVSNRQVESKIDCHMVDPKDAFRAAVQALVKKDANGVCDAIASTSMPLELALSVGIQAWRADVNANKTGVRMHSEGMLSAVFFGTYKSQERSGTLEHGDNAVFLIASLAAKYDNPDILDVLISWEPGFRLGPLEGTTVETTSNFFLDLEAPRCSNRILQRKNELVLAPRNGFLADHAEARALRNAQRIKEKAMCKCEIGNSAIEDIIEDGGRVQVNGFEVGERVQLVSMGLSLLGKPEVIATCELTEKDVVMRKVNDLAQIIARGDEVSSAPVAIGPKHVLRGLLDATKHLRSSKIPDAVKLVV
jgi:hypothetical protein